MTTPTPVPQPNSQVPAEEIDRVRELILGPDRLNGRLQQAEVDRLRTIIFGAQMEEYNRHFADLRHNMERAQRDIHGLQERLLTMEQAHLRRLDALEQDLRRTSDDLRRALERQRGRDEQIHGLQAQLQQQDLARQSLTIQAADLLTAQERQATETRALQTLVSDYRDGAERLTQSLRRELRQTDDTLRMEFRRIADRLEHQKTDRKALAAMLTEVAARLESGDSMTGVFEVLGRSASE
jgi:DNA repair exonuclease SbcCD ATPase subunit